MVPEDKFEQTEEISDASDTNKENKNYESELKAENMVTSDRESYSHRHSSSHHHSSSRHHSDTHHHSSSNHRNKKLLRRKKRRKSDNNSLLKRVQAWINKNVSSKALRVFNMVTVLVVVVSFVVMFFVWKAMLENSIANGDPNINNSIGVPDSSASLTIPLYWQDMVAEKTQTVKELQTAGGRDCVSFVWASDTHIPDNHAARTDFIGRLMAKMLNDCEIPFALLTGDIGTRASYGTEEELIKAQSNIPVHLAPLWGTDRLLVALGNHDGCYGDSAGYYKKQQSPKEMWQIYFRGQALDMRRQFSDDGLYFYVDNIPQKTRFIVLNSQFGGEYAVDGNGWAVNDRFSVSCYGQEQLDWLANVALDLPEGYGAILATHVPPKPLTSAQNEYTVDYAQLNGIINAYCNKTTFSGSYTAGVDGWSNSTVNVDFTNAKGEIIALFAGHVHNDSVDTETLACPIITIISAGAPVNEWSLEEGQIPPECTANTDSETSFDVVTINRKTRTIYCTRVGAGEDRVIPY